MAYSVGVDGEFLLEWCEYIGKPQGWYISYVPQLAVVRYISYVRIYQNLAFNLRYESVVNEHT